MTATQNNPLSPATSASDTEQRYHAGGAFAMKEQGMAEASNVQQASGEARHTPGPWELVEDAHGRGVIQARGQWIATTWTMPGTDVASLPAVANGRLMCAAPDLLAACEAAAAALDYGYVLTKRSGAECPAVTDAVAKIYAAIAKAKGGAA